MRLQLAVALQADWQWAYAVHHDNGAYRPDTVSAGRRALAGMALGFLCLAASHTGDTLWPGKTLQRFKERRQHDRPLQCAQRAGRQRPPDLLGAHRRAFTPCSRTRRWCSTSGLRCKPAPQTGAANVLPAVRQLMAHPDFNLRNPNRARSVIFSYCSGNPGGFHRTDAAGYVFWSERVLELDAINPQVAARLARAMDLLEPLGRTLPQRRTRGAGARSRQTRPEQRRARSRAARAGRRSGQHLAGELRNTLTKSQMRRNIIFICDFVKGSTCSCLTLPTAPTHWWFASTLTLQV